MTFMVGAKQIDFHKIIERYYQTNLIMLLLVMIYSLSGIIQNFVFLRDDIYRYSLGIDYPTDLASYVFFLVLAYCYLNYQKLNYKFYLVTIGLSMMVYFITNSRLDTILIMLVIPLMYIARKAQFYQKQNKLIDYSVDHFWALSIILPYVYILLTSYFSPHNALLKKLNEVLSGRLNYGHIALSRYNYSLFGQKIIEHGWGGLKGFHLSRNNVAAYFYIDSSYIRLIVIYGIIIGLVLMIVMIIISIRETIKKQYALPTIILLVMISSMIDQHLLEITYNIFILALFANTGESKNAKKLFNKWVQKDYYQKCPYHYHFNDSWYIGSRFLC